MKRVQVIFSAGAHREADRVTVYACRRLSGEGGEWYRLPCGGIHLGRFGLHWYRPFRSFLRMLGADDVMLFRPPSGVRMRKWVRDRRRGRRTDGDRGTEITGGAA